MDVQITGKFGLERETLRVNHQGRLAQTKHPFTNNHLSRDFCENQLEIITPVCDSIEAAVKSLAALSKTAENLLAQKNESLWLYSNPPFITSADEIPIAEFNEENIQNRIYREHLARVYGKKMMLYSGIHFNLSFPDFLKDSDNDSFYMKLLKYSTKYSWLLVLLTAASPIYDRSFDDDTQRGMMVSKYTSLRNSERGYWNHFTPILDYSSVRSYCASIQTYIDKGALFSSSELYVPVRIKPPGKNTLQALSEEGIDHIELRMFDLNPLDSNGICQNDLQFSYMLLLYFASLDDFDFTAQMQAEALDNHKKAAYQDWQTIKIDNESICDAANALFDGMSAYFADQSAFLNQINYQRKKLDYQNSYSEQIIHLYKSRIYNCI